MTQREIDFFDSIASSWDADEVRSTPYRIRKILAKLPIRKGMSILDLGTGTGILLPYLSERVGPEGRIMAIDMSEGMLKRAIAKYGHLCNIDFQRIDFEEEHIPGRYDVAMLYSVYPHLHTPSETFNSLFRMSINPGGIIIVAFPCSEKFINDIHQECGADSDNLPSAPVLCKRFKQWGFNAEVIAANEDEYIIIVKNKYKYDSPALLRNE